MVLQTTKKTETVRLDMKTRPNYTKSIKKKNNNHCKCKWKEAGIASVVTVVSDNVYLRTRCIIMDKKKDM